MISVDTGYASQDVFFYDIDSFKWYESISVGNLVLWG